MKRTALLLAAAIGMLGGCGQPQYQLVPTKAENVIEVERTATGFRGRVGIAADSEGTLKGVLLKRDDLEVKLDEGTFAAKPSATYAASAGPMMAYGQQQLNYAEIRRAEWAGFNEFWSNTLQAAAPIVGQYLQGRLSLRQAEMQAPNMREELIRGFAGGQIDLSKIQYLLGQMPEAVSQGFMSDPRVLATLEAIKSQIEAIKNPPPSDQPTLADIAAMIREEVRRATSQPDE